MTPGGNGIFRGTVVVAGNVVGTFTRVGAELDVELFAELAASPAKVLARRRAGFPSGRLDSATP